MKYKHAVDKEDQKLYGVYRHKADELKKEAENLKNKHLQELTALIPKEQQPAWAAAQLQQYVNDRLLPVAVDLDKEQRLKVKEICSRRGDAFFRINNEYELGVFKQETFDEIVEKVLKAGQRKRV